MKINQEFNNDNHKTIIMDNHKTIIMRKQTRNVTRTTCWSRSVGKRSVRLRGH